MAKHESACDFVMNARKLSAGRLYRGNFIHFITFREKRIKKN